MHSNVSTIICDEHTKPYQTLPIIIHIIIKTNKILFFYSTLLYRYSTITITLHISNIQSRQAGEADRSSKCADNNNMGLHKNYIKVGQNAGNQIFGIPRVTRGSTPLSMLISYGAKFNSSKLILSFNKRSSRFLKK